MKVYVVTQSHYDDYDCVEPLAIFDNREAAEQFSVSSDDADDIIEMQVFSTVTDKDEFERLEKIRIAEEHARLKAEAEARKTDFWVCVRMYRAPDCLVNYSREETDDRRTRIEFRQKEVAVKSFVSPDHAAQVAREKCDEFLTNNPNWNPFKITGTAMIGGKDHFMYWDTSKPEHEWIPYNLKNRIEYI